MFLISLKEVTFCSVFGIYMFVYVGLGTSMNRACAECSVVFPRW